MRNNIPSCEEPEINADSFKPMTRTRTKDSCHEGTSRGVCTKTYELHLSVDDFEKLLKDDKAERQSDELYQVMEEESKGNQVCNIEVVNADDLVHSQPLQMKSSVVKRKRGRPRKESYMKTIINASNNSLDPNQPGVGGSIKTFGHFRNNENSGSETDAEIKSKRTRKTKVLHDYVADFNTSDEEKNEKAFRRFSGRGRGRGKMRRKSEFPNAFSDFFSSCNEMLLKKSVIEDVFDESDEYGDKLELQAFDSSNECKQVKDGLEGVIGPGGQTHVRIVNTGDTTVIDDEENFIYNIITTTEGKESIVPIIIPKVTGNRRKEQDCGPTSASATKHSEEEGEVDCVTQMEGTELEAASKETSNNKQQERTFLKQVTSLKGKYYQALQELRTKPHVSTVADLVYGAARFLTDDQLIFLTMQLKSGCPSIPGLKYSSREKMLALAFYLQNPDLYKWLSLIFHLPSKVILERWLEGITRNNPDDAKRLVYDVYTRYIFRP